MKYLNPLDVVTEESSANEFRIDRLPELLLQDHLEVERPIGQPIYDRSFFVAPELNLSDQ